MKKVTMLLLTVILLAMLFPCAYAENEATDSAENDAGWSYSDGTLTIHTDLELSTVPWEEYKPSITRLVLEEGVTITPYRSVEGCTNLTSVSLPSSLRYISWRSFYGCTALETIDLPEGLTNIIAQAFMGCTSLKSVSLPDSLTWLGEESFADCASLSRVSFGSSLKSIMGYAFAGTGLKTIEFPATITNIGYGAFEGSALQSVTIPATLTSIDHHAFNDCASLKTITFEGDCPDVYDVIFKGVTATAYYPADASGWTPEVQTLCGGNITWVAVAEEEPCSHGNTALTGVKEATCSDEGYSGDTVCKDCGVELEKGKKLSRLEHDYQWIVDREATSTENGLKHEECALCGDAKQGVAIPATGQTGETQQPEQSEDDTEDVKQPEKDTSAQQPSDPGQPDDESEDPLPVTSEENNEAKEEEKTAEDPVDAEQDKTGSVDDESDTSLPVTSGGDKTEASEDTASDPSTEVGSETQRENGETPVWIIFAIAALVIIAAAVGFVLKKRK